MTEASPEFVRRTAAALVAGGFPRMPANVLMALMGAEAASLTASELGERVGASAAAISGAVRYLETVRMVHRHRDTGSRRDRWELTEHAWYTAGVMNTALYDQVIGLAETELQRLPRDSEVHERIREMADFMAFVRDALPGILEAWRAGRTGSDR